MPRLYQVFLAFAPAALLAEASSTFPALPGLQGQLSGHSDNMLYLLVFASALPAILGLVVNLVQWLAKRSVDREDKDKAELRAQLKETERAFVEMKGTLDNRFEKQAEFYRTSLKDHAAACEKRLKELEQDLRHDMTRAVADSMKSNGRKR